MLLGINIDHVATVRQARRGLEPDPVAAALAAERGGADSIVCHLREDRRHIQDQDVARLKASIATRLNLEMSCAEPIVRVAEDVRPPQATLVPERRQELTTEGGLDLTRQAARVGEIATRLQKKGITVSLFIDPVERQIRLAKALGVPFIELHTGEYANAKDQATQAHELKRLLDATQLAQSIGLRVNAGHGLNEENVQAVARIEGIEELNIGHAIIARAVMVGIEQAVREMKRAMR